jgi:hypothetical protein
MIQPAVASPVALPPEVSAFAEEQGVGAYLLGVLELTRRVFPDARRFTVLVEDDPEIAGDRHIVFELDVPLTIPQSLAAEWCWSEELFRLCPAPLVCVFRLGTDLVA